MTSDEAREKIEEQRRRQAQQQGQSGGRGVLAATRLSQVEARPVRWLVPRFVPLGKLTMLAGDGGHGKSTITLDLMSRLSRGEPAFGLDYPAIGAASSLLISCEDDVSDTIVPRLEAAGADLERCYHVEGIRGGDGKIQSFCLRHYGILEQYLEEDDTIRLVIIDPAGAYVGRAGVDDNKDSELRSLLAPLTELAARRDVAIIIVKHLNKGANASAVARVGGSTGYVNAVRSALLVAPDREDDARKYLLPMKANLAPAGKGLAYRLRPLGDEEAAPILDRMDHLSQEELDLLRQQLFRVHWQGQVSVTADAALAQPDKRKQASDVQRAAAWLKEFLAKGGRRSEECCSAGNEALAMRHHLVWWRDKVLKEQLGGRPEREGGGAGQTWYWTLRADQHAPHAPHASQYSHAPQYSHPAEDGPIYQLNAYANGARGPSEEHESTEKHEEHESTEEGEV